MPVQVGSRSLARNEEAVLAHTSGVAVVEILAYRNTYARWHFQDKEAARARPDPSAARA